MNRGMSEFGADAAYTVSVGIDAYLEDAPQGRVLSNNGRDILIQVATVVERLPESFKGAHRDLDWVAIARMRNLIARHYDKVDDRLVFSALAIRLPELIDGLDLSS